MEPSDNISSEHGSESHATSTHASSPCTSTRTQSKKNVNTPKTAKQKRIIKKQQQTIRRLKAALSKKKISSKKINEAQVLEEALAKLPKNMANFIQMQVKLCRKSKKGRRFSPELKSLAISIYHASGKAYRMLSKLFILPSKASLKRYISKLPATPGFTQDILNIIKSKVAHMNANEKICSLCMDEMSLKTHLFYDVPADKIVGLEDFGGGYRTNKVATSALVFLIRSISGNWKQPLGYVLVNEACSADETERMMKEAIDKLENIGLKILVVMSDMGSNFHSLARHLGVSPEKPWFIHNNTKYFVMFDPPHLMKCVRNNLLKYSFHFKSFTATWQDIESFYEKDKLQPIRAAPKLTDKHIHPNNFCKMKVKLATQVFSNTAAGICTHVSLGCLPPSAMGTAELLSHFDTLFDCVNSSTLNSPKVFRRALHDESPHIGFLKNSIDFLGGLKVFNAGKDVTGRIKCLNGWLVTINAILSIWEHLKVSHAFKFLLTRRLNTDPIENFFGSIRQQGGNSDNPTPIQFTRAFRKLFFSSFLNSSSGNCDDDLDSLLAQCTGKKGELAEVPVLVVVPPQPNTLVIGSTDYREKDVTVNMLKDNATAYVSGYLTKRCLLQHNCEICKAALISNELDNNRKLLCYFKAYNTGNDLFGGLNAPSLPYLEYIKELENVFCSSFSVYTKSFCVGKHILQKLKAVPLPFQPCPNFPLEFLRKLFLRMRIFYSLKFANRDFSSCKRKDRKYIKISHL